MDRKEFIKRMVKWVLLIFLAGLTAMLGKKVEIKKVCSTCPEYASCPGVSSCDFIAAK